MSAGLVSGREYTKTRPRGAAPWNPGREALEVVSLVHGIVAEYAQPLTIRQIFYRLVGKYAFEKTEKAYSRLGEILNRARRAGLLGWDAIRDDGDYVPEIPGWSGVKQFRNTVIAMEESYFRTPIGDAYVELWCETAGMVPQIQRVADEFGVRVTASGGFASSTQRYYAAQRFMGMAREYDSNPSVLMIGDYDPSGLAIQDSTCADVLAFTARLDVGVSFEPLAVTREQADEYNLQPAPQKVTDNRGAHMVETYQAEALDPRDLASIVHARLLRVIGQEALDESKRQTEADKRILKKRFESLGKGNDNE